MAIAYQTDHLVVCSIKILKYCYKDMHMSRTDKIGPSMNTLKIKLKKNAVCWFLFLA